MKTSEELLRITNVSKTFTLHVQGSAEIPVFASLNLSVGAGRAIAVTGASGVGKSTFLKLLYGTYKAGQGRILLRHEGEWVDIVSAPPRQMLEVRRTTIGYVSQFLRVIPRVATLDVVAEPLTARGVDAGAARDRAAELLERLNIPETLWSLSPLTFSGGEQQRVNIARGFAADYPVMLLDEPTASLDAVNRAVVLDLITEARERGAGLMGIFHDQDARDAVCTDVFDLTEFSEHAYA